MLVSMVFLVILAFIIFGFVLGPVLSARRERIVIDSISLPDPPPRLVEVDSTEEKESSANAKSRSGVESTADTSPVEGNS